MTVLSRGFANNKEWGLVMATLVGATSDTIKSLGMECHVCLGLNIKSNLIHVPCDRLININKSWSKISKSMRSGKYDFTLKYENEGGKQVSEAVTRFSDGLILVVINTKDGSKVEKFSKKCETIDRNKRKKDSNEEKEDKVDKKIMEIKGKKNKRQKRNQVYTYFLL